ncbi:scavenger receptor class B member 1 isoform X6 [Narcine bancroftii]|uniref:scavenger receptor class B member 1 isoform X6 n=1 Tax=Narcine bancroftii TaxID=1343680 RepID=UPI0038318BE3
MKVRPWMLAVIGGLLALAGAVLLWATPAIVHRQVKSNVQVDPESGLAYTMWRDIPVPFYMSVYFFEVKNPQEVLHGEKPVLAQRGPYVYREYKQKSNITFHSNHTVSYREYRRYYFYPDGSAGNESDKLVLPNMLALGAALMVENLPYALKFVFSTALKTFRETPFITKSVKEIMWGYDDPLVDFLNRLFPGIIPFKGKFGLFAEMNNSESGLFTVHTGVDNITKVHIVDNWNGVRKVNYWHSEQCNMINGTAGEMWPPFLTPSDTLTFFSPDSCRTLELVFQKSGWTFDIPSFRYIAPKSMFANGTVYPPNEGFCPCRQSGVLNVSTCRHNSQVFISHPHFYNGDPVLWEAVDGLHPNEKDHALFIDIHPLTGIPLNVSIKLQLNLYVKAVPGITETGNIQPVLLPLLWFDESGYIDGPALNTFYNFLVLLPIIIQYIQYILLTVGSLLMLLALALGIVSLKKQNVQINPKNGFSYSVWKDVPVPFYMSVYFFHVVNPDAILLGKKPVIVQRGPYVYREYRPKGNITFNDNYTVSYRSYRQFHFVPERSAGDEKDQLVLPNMLALGSAILAENLPPALKLAFNIAMKKFNQTAFFRKTVKEIMWGYEDELITFLKTLFPDLLPFKDKFGLFADLNNTDTGLFTINTGVNDIDKVQEIDTWNGAKKVNYWYSDQCNMINGTSGEMWPPFMTPSDSLEFYSPDACRSLELVYQRSAWTFGLPSYRYIAPKTMFANGTVYPPNEGFCPCRQSGALNVSSCRYNSQVFISHPHFYNGDPVLWEAVDGLHPNEKDHALFIDIHPLTGVPLNVSIKLQLNLFLKAAKGIKLTGKMRTMLLPLMWFDEVSPNSFQGQEW